MAFSHPFFLIVRFSCVHGSSLPSDGQAADRSTNFLSRVHGSCLLRPCLLYFFSLLSIPSHRNLPTLCCSSRFLHSPFCFILVGEEDRKLAESQPNGWRLRLPWRRKTIALVRLRTNFGGERWGGCHAMVLKRVDENVQNGVENEVKNDEKYKQKWRKMKQKTKRNK